MKTTIVKCSCDYCNAEMNEYEYENAIKVTVKVNLPNPKGGCGQMSAIEMKLCDKCSKDIGIINSQEYHSYIDSQNRLTTTIKKCKDKILKLCFEKKY